jgi:hypothetical protein
MTKHWWIYGNFPHVFFEAMMVLASLSLNLWLFTGAITLPNIKGLCYNTFDEDGKQALPTACVCQRFQYSTNDWATIVDWYVPRAIAGGAEYGKFFGDGSFQAPGALTNQQAFDLWVKDTTHDKSWVGNARSFEELMSSVYEGDVTREQKVSDRMRKELKTFVENEQYSAESCAGQGIKLARSVSFLTAVYCEMMRAYTVRCAPGSGVNPPWMWEVFNRNTWLHIACTISFWMTIIFVSVPYVQDILHLTRPPFASYFIGIAFPIMNAFFDEFTAKPLYKLLVIAPQQAYQKGFAEGQAKASTNVDAIEDSAAPVGKADDVPEMSI